MQTKTTQELVDILTSERNAFVRGDKNIMTPFAKEDEAAIEQMAGGLAGFIGVQAAWNIGGYHDIREQIQEYQRQHNISGLIRKEISLCGETIAFHRPEDQLILTEEDVTTLASEHRRNIQFFSRYAVRTKSRVGYEFYDDNGGGYWPIEITLKSFNKIAVCMDWAILSIANGITGERYSSALQVETGYGDYHKAAYKDKKSNVWWFYIPID